MVETPMIVAPGHDWLCELNVEGKRDKPYAKCTCEKRLRDRAEKAEAENERLRAAIGEWVAADNARLDAESVYGSGSGADEARHRVMLARDELRRAATERGSNGKTR